MSLYELLVRFQGLPSCKMRMAFTSTRVAPNLWLLSVRTTVGKESLAEVSRDS